MDPLILILAQKSNVISASVNSLDSQIDSLETTVSTLNTNVNSLDLQVDSLDSQVNTSISALDLRINALDAQLNPLVITLSCTPTSAEKGSTVTPVLNWSYSKEIIEQKLDGVSLAVALRTKTMSALTANKTYSLVADGVTKTATLAFYNGVYYGTSSSTTYNAALITSLATKVLTGTKARTITVNASTGQYIYYCLPASLGTPKFVVGGFEGGFSNVQTLSFTNPSGYSESYNIWRSTNAGLGSTSVVIS